MSAIALQEGWEKPSYDQVYRIIRELSPALLTLAHEGAGTYREEYDLLYRREACRSNEIWQADHCLLPIWVKDTQGKTGRPWLTVIEDDKSRVVAGYRFSWSAPSAIQTALTDAGRRSGAKKTGEGPVCGIPEVFYTDHGTDFTSVHFSVMEPGVGEGEGGSAERIERTLVKGARAGCVCPIGVLAAALRRSMGA